MDQGAGDGARAHGADRLGRSVRQIRNYAIIALDPQGVIESWSAGAEQLKGYTAEEAIGRHFAMFYAPDDRRSGLPLQLLDEARASGHVEYTGWRIRKDGTTFWGDIAINAIRDDEGNLTGFLKVTRDATDRHQAEVALRESEERFRLLISQVVDYAIISLDPQGVIETWNAGAERLKGYTAEEAIGRHFAMFYPPEDRLAGLPLQLLDEARAAGHVEHAGWRLRKDGTRFWGDIVITAVRNDRGELTGFGKVTRDRTEARRVEELREALFSGVTHDLRTPIAAITGFAGLVATAEDEEERADLLNGIVKNAEQLASLVDDLLEYARLRSGNVYMDLTPIDVRNVVVEALSLLGPIVGDRDVQVVGEGHRVLADRGALSRIVTNLITNAVQYSTEGTSVVVSIEREQDTVTVTVRDEGRGIAEEDLGTIFNEFERGRLAEDRRGVGLGLAIVRLLVTLQGGKVGIESTIGQGTAVSFDLPAIDAPHRTPRAADLPAGERSDSDEGAG